MLKSQVTHQTPQATFQSLQLSRTQQCSLIKKTVSCLRTGRAYSPHFISNDKDIFYCYIFRQKISSIYFKWCNLKWGDQSGKILGHKLFRKVEINFVHQGVQILTFFLQLSLYLYMAFVCAQMSCPKSKQSVYHQPLGSLRVKNLWLK